MLSRVRTIARQKSYKIFTRPFELNIWGFRSDQTRANQFDDSIHVFYKTNAYDWEYHIFKATTDPGTYWLYNPMHPQGTAILVANQYLNSYEIGMHRGKYLALTQRLKVTVMRDYNRDSTLDFFNGRSDTGLFGINIHRANQSGNTRTVDNHSAGCQVFANIKDFELFMQMCHRHKNLYGNIFSYTLVDFRAVRRAVLRRTLFAGALTATAGMIATYQLTKN